MARTKIGQVSILPCGEYDINKKYERLSVVLFEGSSYIAVKENQGQPITNTEYWFKLTEKGDKGDTYQVTEEDLQEIAENITADANSKFNKHVEEKTTEFDTKVENETTDFDVHVANKITEFDDNAAQKTNEFDANTVEKTNEFNNVVTQKTEEFDEHAESLEKELDWLKSIQDTQVASGENVYFDNAKNYPLMSLKGEGKSEQVTTTGKQLFDKDNVNSISCYIDNSGYLQYSDTNKIVYISCLPNTDYVVSGSNIKGLAFLNETPRLGLTSSNFRNLSASEITLNSGENTYLLVWLNVSTTDGNVENLQIEPGSTATPYESHTGNQPSPNPEYPQEIKTISEASYRGVGKNFIDLTKLDASTPVILKTSGGVASDISSNGFTFTSAGSWSNLYLVFPKNYFVENEDITFSAEFLETVSGRTSPVGFIISGSNTAMEANDYVEIARNYKNISYNTPTYISVTLNVGTYKYIRVRVWCNSTATNIASGESVVKVSKLMLEKGSKATAFEPPHESTLPIDLQGNELASVGTVSDKLLIDRKGNVAIEKNIDKVVLDGSEDEGWIKNTNFVSLFYNDLKSFTGLDNMNIGINIQKFVSDTYIFGGNVNASTEINKIGIYGFIDGSTKTLFKRLNIKHSEEIDLSLEDFKICLSENPVTVYYQLATPELISLDTISNPEIFKGVNNIVVETNLGNMQIEVEYVEDLKLRIEKIEQAIVALGGV